MDSSEANKKFTTQPVDEDAQKKQKGNPLHTMAESTKAAFSAHAANPGPAIKEDFDAKEEGTKEERRHKAQDLNKGN
ncbi:hypothetical protein QBC35DRAFT_450544 [Podospora australis]|uniref:Uncharacterized protein n=1 Tax=Podospora australis TaxID=1536484 RepID=A0AAN7AKD3_9PEZI|nr:hypothetical protein QBC35DRAFT_450544 [Podospora australis]